MISMSNLIIAYDAAKACNAKYFGVIVHNEFTSQNELIVNTIDNMTNGKLEYYKTAYNNDLTLKTQPKIKIVGLSFANTVADLSMDLEY